MTKAAFILFTAALVFLLGCQRESSEAKSEAQVGPQEAGSPAEPSGKVGSPSPSSAAPSPELPGSPELKVVDAPALRAAVLAAKTPWVMVNVWATWCAPCVEEMPDILRFYREHRERGLSLLLVSADLASQKADTLTFLRKMGVDFPSYLQSGDEDAFISAMHPAWDGALPATFFFDQNGKLLQFIGEPVTYASLRASFEKLQQPTPTTTGD